MRARAPTHPPQRGGDLDILRHEDWNDLLAVDHRLHEVAYGSLRQFLTVPKNATVETRSGLGDEGVRCLALEHILAAQRATIAAEVQRADEDAVALEVAQAAAQADAHAAAARRAARAVRLHEAVLAAAQGAARALRLHRPHGAFGVRRHLQAGDPERSAPVVRGRHRRARERDDPTYSMWYARDPDTGEWIAPPEAVYNTLSEYDRSPPATDSESDMDNGIDHLEDLTDAFDDDDYLG